MKKQPHSKKPSARKPAGAAKRKSAGRPAMRVVPTAPSPSGRNVDDDALYEAQQIIYQALEARDSATRAKLARRALEVSADCADAYVLLAQEASTSIEDALALYQQGVAAGERAIGEHALIDDEGHFWGLLETRPYMRARFGLAQSLQKLGRTNEARDHMFALLRLNPNDNQGVRDVLAAMLAEQGDDDALADLLARFEDDSSATWAWTRVLLAHNRDATARQMDSFGGRAGVVGPADPLT
jgi:tetratricopeptide (TPR) repeat protein